VTVQVRQQSKKVRKKKWEIGESKPIEEHSWEKENGEKY
jgi:hypothetical protein